MAESPEKEGRIILESSTESERGGEKRRGKLTSSTESSSSSSSKVRANLLLNSAAKIPKAIAHGFFKNGSEITKNFYYIF